MKDDDIRARARAVLAAALPGAYDGTEDPHGRAPARLPAFAVLVNRTSAELVAMGSTEHDCVGELVAEILDQDASDPRAAMAARRDAAAAALRDDAPLTALLLTPPVLATAEIDVEAGETRSGRAMLRFDLRYLSDA